MRKKKHIEVGIKNLAKVKYVSKKEPVTLKPGSCAIIEEGGFFRKRYVVFCNRNGRVTIQRFECSALSKRSFVSCKKVL